MRILATPRVAQPLHTSAQLHHHLTRHYIAALLTLAVIAIASQILVQFQLAQQAADARVINIAGKQRMLSQRISKDVLALSSITNSAMLHQYRKELEQNIARWETSQRGLQTGSSDLGLPGNNSAIVQRLFAQQQPYYDELYRVARQVSERNLPPTPAQIQTVLANEPYFLELMDQIVFQYDREARARVEQLRLIQLGLLGLFLTALLMQGLFIFRPAVRQMRTAVDEIEAAKQRTQETATRLQVSNQELHHTTQQLAATNARLQQEEVRQQQHIALLEAYQQTIRSMSTPVVPIADGVLVVPLIGELDAERADNFQRVLLQAIGTGHAHTVIVDLTGLVLRAGETIQTLLQTIQAAHLLGARTILTGISPHMARMLTETGIELDQIRTFTTLQQGVAVATRTRHMGY